MLFFHRVGEPVLENGPNDIVDRDGLRIRSRVAVAIGGRDREVEHLIAFTEPAW